MAEHQLNWTPGSWGKGMIFSPGEVWTWNTDGQYGSPHHAEMLTGEMEDTPMAHKDHQAFEIFPDGRFIWSMLAPGGLAAAEEIKQADPRLHLGEDDFHFGTVKEASKLDWLSERPDFQKPEKRPLLDYFKRLTESPGNDKIDPLLPWIAREVKKGRLRHVPHPQNAGRLFSVGPADPHLTDDEYQGVHGVPRETEEMPVHTGDLAHMADWYHSDSPTRKGADIMQLTYPEVRNRIEQWNEELRAKQEEADRDAVANAGNVVHSWPDNWTIRQLNPEDLQGEGDIMGHCVGGYGYENEVANGNTMIYSLRDHKGQPHATAEITPTQWENLGPEGGLTTKQYGGDQNMELNAATPYKGQIVQVQGKSDAVPIPEYQKRFKDWFQTFPEDQRPYWDAEEDISEPRGLVEHPEFGERNDNWGYEGYDQGGYGPHGDYGVETKQKADYDWLLKNTATDEREHANNQGYAHRIDRDNPHAIYLHAYNNKEIPELGKAVEQFGQDQQDDYDRYDNRDYSIPPPFDEQYPMTPESEGYPIPQEHYRHGEDIPDLETHQQMADEDETQLQEQHPGMQLTNYMYRLLNPHFGYGPEGDPDVGIFQNELQTDPTAYYKEHNPEAETMWTHPAQHHWDREHVFSKVADHPNRQRWLDAWDEYLTQPDRGWRRYQDWENGNSVVEHVPVEALRPYVEYDRDIEGQQYTRDLRDHIAQHGIQEPIFMDYNPDTQLAHISEGNHRMKIADQLGITHVPVVGYRSRRPADDAKPVPGSPVDPQRHDAEYVPPYFPPSALGLPTADQRTAASAFATELKLWLDDVGSYLAQPHHQGAKHKKKRQLKPRVIPLKDQYDAQKREWYDSDDGEGSALEFPYEPQPYRKEHHAPIPQLAHVEWQWSE